MKKSTLKFAGLILLALLIASCAPKAEPAAAAPTTAEAALTLFGAADASWTMDDLQAMPVTKADYTNKDGETTTYSGVAISALLENAGVGSFSSLTFVASDGYTADVTADEISGCASCIVAIDNGSLRTVMPDFSGKLQVKDLTEIKVN